MGSIKEYWDRMSPAERGMEMRRRLQSRVRDKPGRRISTAGRENIREAQRRRWREQKQLKRATQSPFPRETHSLIKQASTRSLRNLVHDLETILEELKIMFEF